MKSMIFAAGLGTRLKPITDTMPKALVPVCGRPLIEHVMRKLAAAGITGTAVNVHHFADMLEEWLAGRDWISLTGSPAGEYGAQAAPYMDGHSSGCGAQASDSAEDGKMSVYVSDEKDCLLDTGGAVLHARPFLEGCGSFLVHNVDILSNCDLRWFTSQTKPDALATLLVSRRKTRRYLLFEPETMRLAGWTDTVSGQVRMSSASVRPSDCIALAFSGIHIMSDRIFGIMEDYVRAKNPDASGCPARFSITDFYIDNAAHYPVYGVCCDGLELLDVGKLDALAPAEDFVKKWKI